MKTIKNLLSIFIIITSLNFVSCENEPLDPSLLNQQNNDDNQDPVDENLPVLTTITISSITTTTATSGGSITLDGGSPVTSRGVVWSTSQNPTIADSKTIDGTGIGSFGSSISGLTTNTTYYVRAYATNADGTAYGNQLTFMTSAAANLPVLTTSPITSIASTSATSGGSITLDGGSAVTSRGVVWSTSQNPTIANPKTVDGTGTGSFSSSISGLTANTTYYVRAYATNANGTSYGNQVTFATGVSQVDNTPALMTANINGVQYNNMKPYMYSFIGNDVIVTNSAVVSGLKNLKIQGDTSDNLTFLTEINFWIPDTKWVVGTYPLTDTDFGNPLDCQVDLVLPYVGGFPDYADITGGSITITEFNLTTKRIKGTFNISYQKGGLPTTYQITNGTFNYGLDDPHFN